MDIPNDIGKHCTLASCNELDFLPIECNHCHQIYCRNHVFPDYHKCESVVVTSTPAASSSSTASERCAFERCNKQSLESFISDRSENASRTPALCARCNKSFCVDHRHTSSHACSASQPGPIRSSKNEAARALLAKHFPMTTKSATPPSSASSKPKTSDPNKLAQFQKLELMKMRHRALPGDPKDKTASVAIDQRVHVRVTLEDHPSTSAVFWFRKTLITGKAIDCLASHFTVSPPLELRLAESEEHPPLLLNQPLSTQILDGSSTVLVRVVTELQSSNKK